MRHKYYWKNIEKHCNYFITEDNTVLTIEEMESEEWKSALNEGRKYDVIKILFAVGKTFDLQSFLTSLHPLCHSQTRIIVVYYNFLWEPFIRFAEWMGIKNKTGISN